MILMRAHGKARKAIGLLAGTVGRQ